jgi:hypothetical protein
MRSIILRLLSSACLIGALLSGQEPLAVAQQPKPTVDAQREAMRRLGFLVGHWAGPVTVVRGPGEPGHLTQREDVKLKLDGLVLLIEGRSTDASGKAVFQALATIAYDDASHTYRIRAYNDGHYIDTEFVVADDGFSWGFTSGPAKIQNTMRLTAKGEWQETTEVAFGENPPRRSVDMLLQRQQ